MNNDVHVCDRCGTRNGIKTDDGEVLCMVCSYGGPIFLPKNRIQGRNEKCRCGSKLKYKHCHGKPI